MAQVFVSYSQKDREFVLVARNARLRSTGHSPNSGWQDNIASGAAVAPAQAGTSRAPKRNFASRVFGYDLFISFALGPPPRGTHSYASDLARRLRERDFTVFFSEDEAAPGEQLDSTLLKALYRSRTLVVIAKGTLQEPRSVRQEVEALRSRHPDRPIIPISVGGALQDVTPNKGRDIRLCSAVTDSRRLAQPNRARNYT